MSERYGLLDVHNVPQLREYEEYFYEAYVRVGDNSLTRTIWDWDDPKRRLRVRIPYEHQSVYTWRNAAGHLLGSMAVSLSQAEFQSEVFGFTPDPCCRPHCEILSVFSTPHLRRSALRSYSAFICNYGFRDLMLQGYDVAFSTCARRRLRPYLRLGAQLLTSAEIGDEERFFLLWRLRDLVNRSSVQQVERWPGSGKP